MKASLMAAALAALAAGCATVEISSPGSMNGIDIQGATTRADRMVFVSNTGIHLFGTFTICSGGLVWNEEKQDIEGGVAFFSDYCGNDDCYETLQRIARRENCDLVDVVFTEASTSDFSCSSYEGLLGGICGTYSVKASAVLREKSQRAGKEAVK